MMVKGSCRGLALLALATLLCCVLSSARILPSRAKCGVKPAVTTAIAFVADSSAGMSKDQFLLHKQSFANIIGDASVIPTNSSVAIGMWVYAGRPVEVFPPTVVDSPQTAQRLAGLAANAPRIPGHTATGDAIKTATSAFSKSALTATQTVVFVSATRKANSGVAPSTAANDAAAKGVRVSCIAMQSLSSCDFKAGAGSVATRSTVSTFEKVLRPLVTAQSVAPKQSSASVVTLFSKYVSAVLDPSDLFSTAPEQGTVEVNPPPPPKPTPTNNVVPVVPVTPAVPVTPVTPTTTVPTLSKTEESVTKAPPPSPPAVKPSTTKIPQDNGTPIVKVPNDLPNIPTDDVQISVGPPKAPATTSVTPPPPPPPPAVAPNPPAPQRPPPPPPSTPALPAEQLSGNGLPERPTSSPVPVKRWPQKPYRPRRFFPARVCGCGSSSGTAGRSSTFAPSPAWALALAGQPVASARQLLAYKRLLTKRRFEAFLNASLPQAAIASSTESSPAVPAISPFDNPECVCNRSATRLPTIYVLSPHIFNNSGAIGNIRMVKEEKKPERFFYYVLHSGAEPQFSATQCLQQTMYQLQQPAAPLGDAAPPRSNMIVAPFTPRMASLCSQKADNTPATQCSPSMPCGAPGLPCCASFVEEGMHIVHVTGDPTSEHSEADEEAMEDLASLLEEANQDADALQENTRSKPRRVRSQSHRPSGRGNGSGSSSSRPRKPNGNSGGSSGTSGRRPRKPSGNSGGSSGTSGRHHRRPNSGSSGSSGTSGRHHRRPNSGSSGSSGRPRDIRRPRGGSSGRPVTRPRPLPRPHPRPRPGIWTRPRPPIGLRPRPYRPVTGKTTSGANNAEVLQKANEYLTKGMATFDYAKLRDDFVQGILSKPYAPVTFIAAIKSKNSKGERYSQMESAANIYLWSLPDDECPTLDSKKLKASTKFAIAAFRLRKIVGVRGLKRLYYLVMNGQHHGAPAFSSDPALKSFAAALISALGASAQSKKVWQNMVRAKIEQRDSVFLAQGLKLLAFSKSKKIVSADSKTYLKKMFDARGDPLTFIHQWADNNDARLFANWNSQANAKSARPWNPSAHPALDARARNVQEAMFKASFGDAFAAIRKEFKTVETFGQAAAAAAASGDDAIDSTDASSGAVAAVQTRNQMMQTFKAKEKQFFQTNPLAKLLVGTKTANTGGEYTIIKKQRFQKLLQNVDKLYKPALANGKAAFARQGGLKTAERSLTIAAAKAAFYGPLIVQKASSTRK